MDLMCVRPSEVIATILDPEIVAPNSDRRVGGWTFHSPRLCVVVAPDRTIVTVLWRGADGRNPDGTPKIGEMR